MVWFILVEIKGLSEVIFAELVRCSTIGIRALSLAKEGNDFLVLLHNF